MMRRAFIRMLKYVLPVFVLYGCATPGSIIGSAAGPEPSKLQIKQFLLANMKKDFHDMGNLQQINIVEGPLLFEFGSFIRREEAWFVCYEYRARTVDGGYSDPVRHRVAIRASVNVHHPDAKPPRSYRSLTQLNGASAQLADKPC